MRALGNTSNTSKTLKTPKTAFTSAAFVAVIGLGLMTGGLSLSAHHSFSSEFDAQKPLTLKGKFTQMDWVNPHSWVHFDVTAPDGKVVNWAAETPPPNVLFRSGWKRDVLKGGEEIEIRGFAAKDGTPHMWASSVVLVASGQRILSMTPPAVAQ